MRNPTAPLQWIVGLRAVGPLLAQVTLGRANLQVFETRRPLPCCELSGLEVKTRSGLHGHMAPCARCAKKRFTQYTTQRLTKRDGNNLAGRLRGSSGPVAAPLRTQETAQEPASMRIGEESTDADAKTRTLRA